MLYVYVIHKLCKGDLKKKQADCLVGLALGELFNSMAIH
jgi:hypothetical protein